MKQFVAGDIGPGEMGTGIELQNVNPYVRKLKADMFKGQGFDEYISENLVSLNRTLPDRRDYWCRANTLIDSNYLPSTSVIIIFHNEAWSTLIRTVYSVINRSPPHLLAEIILVDDASTLPRLGQELQDAVNLMPKVKLIRQKERKGLMVTRMSGVLESTSQVLTFLDSHIEATEGWLEPLMERIHLNPKAIACPVIEEVNDKTFQYKFVTRDLVGVFFWNLDFGWTQIHIPTWAPYTTPVMAGGLFSIRKDWFAQLGFYDEGMEIWGGEQLELSFKTWMCGGVIEIVPCSRVGHIFRSFSPYKWTAKVKLPEYNYKRVAEVWMDEYKELYYDTLGTTKTSREENIGDFGDVADRKILRESLQCKNFAWYLENQMPDLYRNAILGAGEIRNFHQQFCLDQQDNEHNVGLAVLVFDCHGLKGNQYWYYTRDKKITRHFLCMGRRRKGSKNDNQIELVPCDGGDTWDYNPRSALLKHEESKLCLKVTRTPLKLWLKPCNMQDTEQKWYFTNFDEEGLFVEKERESTDKIEL
eukprot:GFUD01068747.1.p1 GENE.GFUD01068747.1~~GFUD01068747.1.p1  ORF type:complete len:529 (+),score=152.63 GFUD01068747.1:378-1964(+)